MIKAKICLIGSYAVGKSSLVKRFVAGIFSDQYQTTIGVKIDKKIVTLGQEDMTLVIWDLAGEDEFQQVPENFIQGSSGYFLVADCTRPESLTMTLDLHLRFRKILGPVPYLFLLNKWDLSGESDLEESVITEILSDGGEMIKTSAKTGDGVEEAFHRLALKISSIGKEDIRII